ncbi:MAG: 5-(carboxyamino)imidazole ribonucleotide mutase [Acidobacteriia bacterium]|nr:5-(carboxyamino)imidazole ribonucleotide mutase [Terriglobia bacterium]
MNPIVGIVMGSDSDLPVMTESAKRLKEFDIPFEMEITSAHRSPVRTSEYARQARERGLKAIIVGAGGASHLAGIIAAETTIPVIGVPIDNSPLSGIDSLLSTVQMPSGVPVATMAVGKAGAVNAAIFAAEIIGTSNPAMADKLATFKIELEKSVVEKSEKIKRDFKV